MNRRSFIKRCFAGVASACAILAPGKAKPNCSPIIPAYEGFVEEDLWDSMLLEDNKTYKGIPGSGPQHYVGQVLKYRDGRKSIICTKVLDSHSLWRELPVKA